MFLYTTHSYAKYTNYIIKVQNIYYGCIYIVSYLIFCAIMLLYTLSYVVSTIDIGMSDLRLVLIMKTGFLGALSINT